MKKILTVLITVLIAVAIIVGCIHTYNYFTTEKVRTPSGDMLSSGETSGEKIIDHEPIFTLETYPKIAASTAIHPLVEEIAKNFLGEEADKLEVDYLNTHPGFTSVVDGTKDVCFMAYPSDEEMAYAKEKGVELEIIKTTNSAFVFIVNTENKVDNLTLEQVKDIYSGKITNWKEVGGEDAPIIAYQRPINSGSQSGMLQLVMKDTKMIDPPLTQITVGMGDLVDAIAEYDNAKDALGYSYFYYVNTMYKRDTIKILSIDGIPADYNTICNGMYPIMTSGYLVIRKNESEDSNTRKWVKAVLSDRGAGIISEAGYVPVK